MIEVKPKSFGDTCRLLGGFYTRSDSSEKCIIDITNLRYLLIKNEHALRVFTLSNRKTKLIAEMSPPETYSCSVSLEGGDVEAVMCDIGTRVKILRKGEEFPSEVVSVWEFLEVPYRITVRHDALVPIVTDKGEAVGRVVIDRAKTFEIALSPNEIRRRKERILETLKKLTENYI